MNTSKLCGEWDTNLKSKSSLKNKITFIFSIILMLIFVSNFLINNILLDKYYVYKKEQQLKNIYNQLNQDLSEDDLFSLYKSCSIQNVNIITIGINNNINVYICNNKMNNLDKNLEMRISQYISGKINKKDLIQKTDNYGIYLTNDNYLNISYIEMFGKLNDNSYFIIRTPMDSIEESISILNNFTLITFIICFILGVIVIKVSTTKIIKPINRLCELSNKMSSLDFSERYNESNSTKEIDILGDNFNNLSSSLENALNQLTLTNEQLKKELDEKIQIDDMRKDFISNVSHELKTPIALIQGYSEGLKDCVNDEEKDYYCDVIIDESQKMNSLVKQLINLNQIEFGGDSLVIEKFNIVELTRGVIQSLDLIAKEKNINIKIISEDFIEVSADQFRTEQIIVNYITNALNHVDDIETNTREIIVSIANNNDKVRLSVFNTGSHIPEDELDKIWIKFYKTDKARTREYGGSGIGLSIVAAIMNLYHENYGVINKENGVEFWIDLKK